MMHLLMIELVSILKIDKNDTFEVFEMDFQKNRKKKDQKF